MTRSREIRVEGDRVVLRAVRPGERRSFVEAHMRSTHIPGIRPSPDRYRRRVERSGRWADARLDLAVEAEGRVIGEINAWRGWTHGLPPGVVEVGLMLHDEGDRRHGYGTEATRLVAEALLERKDAERVQASTEVENHAARRVLEKAGFAFEGVLQGYFPRDGRGRADYAMYARVVSGARS